jgi:16S rRNA (uracil1498-N3)-methyltransferase
MHRVRPSRCLVTCSAPRLFASPLPAVGARLSLSAEESRHATRSLRLREGDAVELFDGDGGCVAARIVAVDARGGAAVEACGAAARVPWSGPRWDVAVACVGLTQRADWAVEKCAELGVASFIPLLTERSAATKQQRAEQTKEWQRWERLSLAASKQCLRLHSLKVTPATPLSELLPAVCASPLALVALQGGAPLRDVLASHPAAAQTGGLLIVGPPGDFSDAEKEALRHAGALGVGLGLLRLRTETAAIALSAACVLH